jgi:hypothetical protein
MEMRENTDWTSKDFRTSRQLDKVIGQLEAGSLGRLLRWRLTLKKRWLERRIG